MSLSPEDNAVGSRWSPDVSTEMEILEPVIMKTTTQQTQIAFNHAVGPCSTQASFTRLPPEALSLPLLSPRCETAKGDDTICFSAKQTLMGKREERNNNDLGGDEI